ncbi:MAG: hypothetical protein PVF27_01810 [Gemmatimonadales bacterium]|jgi:hypothetical protein
MNDRAIARGAAVFVAALVLGSCNEQRLQPFVQDDTFPPSVVIDKTAGDTLDVTEGIQFDVTATDNLGLKVLSVSLTGGYLAQLDSVFTSAVTSVTRSVDIPLPNNTPAGGWVIITASVSDGRDNSASAVDSIFLVNEAALTVELLNPTAGAVTSPGKLIQVNVRARQRDGIRWVGYLLDGVVTGGDSIGELALPPDTTYSRVDTIPSGTNEGQFTVTGFAIDSATRRVTTSPITLSVQSASNDQTPPTVNHTIADRVEVDDSITVNATDASGITKMGWIATRLSDGALVGGDSSTYSGEFTDVTEKWRLNFNFTTLPQSLVITSFAEDGASPANRGTSGTSGAPPAAGPAAAAGAAMALDTVIVVHGITTQLPEGGRIADALYNVTQNEIYLSNIQLDQLEIFRLTDTTFLDPIPVGSRPWGLAFWPVDRNGTHSDTVVVANSGGTNLSIVDVRPGSRLETRRHALPIMRIQSVQSKIDDATGQIKPDIKEYILSDRPQYVSTVCRSAAPPACDANGVLAFFSTLPTQAQSDPFPGRGTVRWENISSAAVDESHFVWEHAAELISDTKDTLQVIERQEDASEELLLDAFCGVIVSIEELGWIDTTFVRNSGNFQRTLIGEGGSAEDPPLGFGRAMGYDVDGGITTSCFRDLDFDGTLEALPLYLDNGVSGSINVRDFIANTAVLVKSIAINFNGQTNLIRADSIYVLDGNLRLQGLVQVGGTNPGMDLNFDHAFDASSRGTGGLGGTGDPNDRLLFAASSDPVIEVYDTYFFGRVTRVPIKDPVIGPLRVAELASGEQILVGVTVNGLVIVTLPSVTNAFPTSTWGAPGN